MSEPRTNRKQDAKLIAITQRHEVHRWCDVLGVTEDELRAAVKAVGPSVRAVRAHLGKTDPQS